MVNRLAEMGKNALNNVESKLKEFENSIKNGNSENIFDKIFNKNP